MCLDYKGSSNDGPFCKTFQMWIDRDSLKNDESILVNMQGMIYSQWEIFTPGCIKSLSCGDGFLFREELKYMPL